MARQSREDVRNLALIAHVDHGKTTLSDAILRRGGARTRGLRMNDGRHPGDEPRADPGIAAGPDAEAIDRARRLVPLLARRYASRGMGLGELVAAGNLGLVEAARRFDGTRGVRFSTYAAWWIRKAIVDALGEQTGPLRLPRYQHDRLRTMRQARASWLVSHGAPPTVDELSVAAGLSADEISELDLLSGTTVSLDQPLTADDSRSVKDLLGNVEAEDPGRALDDADLRGLLHRRLAELAQRERQVLTLRYGLGDGVSYTLRETGRRLGISRERVRQVELRALGRLRREIS